MRLAGLHHVTMITGDAVRNVDFYAGVLGLRLVKKTVNFDQPDAYHLYFGDESGTPGSLLTWFEFPGARAGRPGAGMIHRLELGVAGEPALEFWRDRLADHRYPATEGEASLWFSDYDGLELELVMQPSEDRALIAEHPEIPREHAIAGMAGARAFAPDHDLPHAFLVDVLGFDESDPAGAFVLRGTERSFRWAYDPAPPERGMQGAGTVHHIAWHSPDEDHLAWQSRVREAGAQVTDVKDRDYFRSIYFREPRGILFEIATTNPGFAVDEDPDYLGEELRVPKMHAHLREQLERTLTPIENPRLTRAGR